MENTNKEANNSYNTKNISYETQTNDKQKKPTYAFPELNDEEITFGTQNINQTEPKAKLFVKKSQSYGN